MLKVRLLLLLGGTALAGVLAAGGASSALADEYGKTSCQDPASLCTEISNPPASWKYVGHDEPSVLFYSGVPGSGNNTTYQLTLPSDPSGPFSASNSYNFELHPTFWFGMAMCDTQSYPELTSKCPPDSDANAVPVGTNTKHPGTAFEELQFYPPGWISQFAGSSCDPTRWCAALTIDSLSENPLTGGLLNASCQSRILGGLEYVNFAYLTRTGVPQGPPNPLQFDPVASGKPGSTVLYMKSGDQLTVSLHDSPDGLVTSVTDNTSGKSGLMTASAANGFGQIKFAPTGTKCTEMPYTFHPEYSTSSTTTRVPWAAHTYNIAFSDELGHLQFCTHVDPITGSCDGMEGAPGNLQPADADDQACFTSEMTLLYPVTGCEGTNAPGFDGASYQPDWPDGSPNHPTSVLFSSPVTVGGTTYPQAAFENDMPRIEAADLGGSCNRTTGVGCTNPPPTDQGVPAAFYPYYSTTSSGPNGSCMWGLGSTLPNTTTDFGKSAQWGALNPQTYYIAGGKGATHQVIDTYRNILPNNPC
jgi:hypothetical protein